MSKRSFDLRKALKMFRRGDAGNALVETALTFSILTTLLIGVAEMARIAFAAIEVTNAARAAAQYAAMNGGAFNTNDSSGLDTTGMLNAAQADAGNLGGSAAPVFANTPTYTCSCTGTGTASCVAPSTPSGCTTSHIVATVTVHMKTTYTSVVRLPGLPATYTLYGYDVEQVLQ